MKRKNPSTNTLLLVGAGAGLAYYFLVHKKKEEKKQVEAAVSLIAAAAPPKTDLSKLNLGFGTLTSGRQAGFALPKLTLGTLGGCANGSLG